MASRKENRMKHTIYIISEFDFVNADMKEHLDAIKRLGGKVYELNGNTAELIYRVSQNIKKSNKIFKDEESVAKLKMIVCDEFGIQSLKELESRRRDGDIPMARHIVSTLLYKDGYGSTERIGMLMGGRDHATVLNSMKVVQNIIDTKNIVYLAPLKRICEKTGMLTKMKLNDV